MKLSAVSSLSAAASTKALTTRFPYEGQLPEEKRTEEHQTIWYRPRHHPGWPAPLFSDFSRLHAVPLHQRSLVFRSRRKLP
jgi:hypothetical protein